MNSSASISGLQAAFTWVWQNSLAGSMVIVFIGLLLLCFRRWLPVRLAYWLWCCALLRLLLPITPASPLSLFNLLPQASSDLEWHAVSDRVEPPASALSPAPVAGQVAPMEPLLLPQAGKAGLSSSSRSAWPPLNLIAILWSLGGIAYLPIVLWKHRKLSRFLSHQKPIDDPRLQNCIAEGMRLFDLRRPVQAYEPRHDQAPAIFGFFRPRLLISGSVLRQLSDAELRLLVLHELAHVARRDVLLNWAAILIQALHWFNPFVWLALKQWRAAREAVCDARVLSLLETGERHAYGTMLLKIASNSLEPAVPGLVPVFKTKKEIHRRIIMIARFKPATRIAAVGSAVILALIALTTLTGAGNNPGAPAGKTVPPPAVTTPPAGAGMPAAGTPATPGAAGLPSRNNQERVAILRKALAEQNDKVEICQVKLSELRSKLGITEEDEKQRSESSSILLRKMEALKAEANAEYIQISSLVKQLSSLPRAELRRAVPVVSPDLQINNLLQDYAASQQTLVEISDQVSPEHPDVKRVKARVSTIDKQINDRLDGILAGLKARASISKSKLDEFDKEIERTSHVAIEKSLASRPYFDQKRELESQIALRDRLLVRIQEEELNALLQDK